MWAFLAQLVGTTLMPDRNLNAESPQASRSASVLTVTQLSAAVRSAISATFPQTLRVLGEVSNFSDRSHWFFTLKDEGSSVRCVCFASHARKVGFTPRDGMQLLCSGRLDYYEASGQLQFYVDRVEPVGQGALELRFRVLCDELRKLGYFAAERKKPLPVLPQTVAVVTSRSAAALQDVINTARRRWPGCKLALLDVRVQGAHAAPQIAEALKHLGEQGPALGIDVILLTRGGGSIEDLWAFNERSVADAIFRCPLPVVAAIGHETDTTIAELVADVRASTPTQAAMMIVPDVASLALQVHQLDRRLGLVLQGRLDRARQRLGSALRHPMLRHPAAMLQARRASLEALEGRLPRSLQRMVSFWNEKLRVIEQRLHALGPMQVLSRGYSYTLTPQGQVVRSPQQAPPGSVITSVLAEGRVQSVVQGEGPAPQPAKVERGGAQEAAVQRKAGRPRKANAADPSQPRLF